MRNDPFIERVVVDFSVDDLPFGAGDQNIRLHDPSKVRLKLAHRKYPRDIGALAYARRKRKGAKGRSDYTVLLVDPKSFQQNRVAALENFFDSLLTASQTGQLRERTVDVILSNCFFFLDWCDLNNYSCVLDNVQTARCALRAYIIFLEHRVKTGQISINSAALHQNKAITMLEWMLALHRDELTPGIRKIAINTSANNTTLPPDAGPVKQVLTLCDSIFIGLTDFVVSYKTYPLLFNLPNENVWLVPSTKWMATKEQLQGREQWKQGGWAWNYETGSINKIKDIFLKYTHDYEEGKVGAARHSIRKAKSCLKRANENPRYIARLKLGSWAYDAFIVLFFANTGMNLAQVISLEWSDKFEVGNDQQGFRSIKYRAQGKDVQFYISSGFLPKFKEFLKLRSYMLDGKIFPFLFFSLGAKSLNTPKKMREHVLTSFFQRTRRSIDPNIRTISSRQWRSYKSDYLIRSTDVATTAMILQNSPTTILRAYVEGSESVSSEEMANFFHAFNRHIFIHEKPIEHIPSPVGHCSNMNQPTIETTTPSIVPDCIQPEGCIFCEHYAIHADEKDVRKLCSLSYVITETMPLSQSLEHHAHIFGGVLNRIEAILSALSSTSKEMTDLVAHIKDDVRNNETLDPYWEGKLAMLCDIGAL